jgi:hypothetical protein
MIVKLGYQFHSIGYSRVTAKKKARELKRKGVKARIKFCKFCNHFHVSYGTFKMRQEK